MTTASETPTTATDRLRRSRAPGTAPRWKLQRLPGLSMIKVSLHPFFRSSLKFLLDLFFYYYFFSCDFRKEPCMVLYDYHCCNWFKEIGSITTIVIIIAIIIITIFLNYKLSTFFICSMRRGSEQYIGITH